ncbi:hypothetical protein RB653_001219 [Dictyostelium firmibasis]|uniref:Endoglucanase n=1 Tax=Dictyostelium firmibasis TaxID=79012 RepID=A0AAN7TWL6_9MYCE
MRKNNLNKIIVVILFSLLISINFTNADNCSTLKQAILFYKAQRAGRLPDTDIPWRGNSVLTDASPGSSLDSNGDGDLSKGFFDAGDGVKFGLPMCWSITMLGWNYIEYSSNIASCGLTDLYLNVLKWGTDYILASHLSDNVFVAQVGDGNVDHSVWEPPEFINYIRPVYLINSSYPGTELAMEAAAALAAASIAFKSTNPSYASTCLSHAKTLYNFGNTYQGSYSVSVPQAAAFYNSYSGYTDELVWGSVWLYKATGDSSYLSAAENYYSTNNVGYDGTSNSFDWDQTATGSSLLLYKLTGKAFYQQMMDQTMKYWSKGGGITYTPGGLAWIREWGPCRYSMSMAFIATVYGTDSSLQFAQDQLNYVLGAKTGQSFIVGIGSNHPINPHHRAAHHSTTNDINNPVNNLYMLYGALVGGPGSDDSYVDLRTDYVKNEVALDYNAGFVGTLSYFAQGSSSSTTTPSTTTSSTTTTPSTTTTTPSSTTTSTPTPTSTTTTTPSSTTSTTTSTPSSTTSTTTTSTPSPTTTSTPSPTTSNPSSTTSTPSPTITITTISSSTTTSISTPTPSQTTGDGTTTSETTTGDIGTSGDGSNGTSPTIKPTSTSGSTSKPGSGSSQNTPGIEKDGSSSDALCLSDIIPLSIITLFILSSIHLLLTN